MKPILAFALFAGLVGFWIIVYFFAATLSGKINPTILCWVLIFPLGYYCLSFPREKSIITLDRILVIMLLLAIGFASRERSDRWPAALRSTSIAWMAFLAVGAASLAYGGNAVVSGRLLVDGFLLPGILGWTVISYFRVEQNTAKLHLFTSLMSVYVACIGLGEMVLREDLLPLPGAAIGFAGVLPRPNGPFATDDSFALIGLVTFFFLSFLRNMLGDDISSGQKLVHYVGLTASLATALMPMFRSVVISLMVVLLIATLATRRPSKRMAGFGLLIACVLMVTLVSILAPDTYEDRSSLGNLYGRFAQQMQTWYLFSNHPIFGVGIGRFSEAVNGDSRYLAFYGSVRSVDSPHNTLGGILAETGLLGFIPYFTAQVALFLAFWRLRRQSTRTAKLAWTYFLYIFLGYWINGMALASGYSSDLNFWYIFSISVLYKFSMTRGSRDLASPHEEAAPVLASSVL